MLHATVRRHDRFQIELKVSHSLPSTSGDQVHELGLYFFAPRNLGVRRENYPKAQFYNDLQSYLRLTTPSVPLDGFVRGPASPLARLRAKLESAGKARESDRGYGAAIKLFCSMLKSSVRDFSLRIRQTEGPEERGRLVGTLVESLQEICREYRALRTRIRELDVPERTFEVYLFGDEWLSLLVEDRGYRLLEELGEAGVTRAGVAALQGLVEGENRYRAASGYPSVFADHGDNELPIFRRSVLKKYVASILFLQTEVRKDGAVVRETLFGVAAALAMVFATAVAFAAQSIYGALTPAVFVTLVVSYIFKDRLKELLRTYFQKRMAGFLFDQKTVVREAGRRAVGVCRESFDFADEKRVPAAVRELRARSHIAEIENEWMGEQVLVYRKRVRLDARAVHETFSDYVVPGVTDIMRFNVSEFLRRMDDPTKELFVMDDEGYQRIKGTRVYHLNLILHLRGNENEELSRYRVVLTRKGIKRIERVSTA